MRREYSALAAALGVIAAIMASVVLQPQLGPAARHTDPAQAAAEMPSPALLALVYSSVFSNISSGDFDEAYRALSSLDGVYVPENARYIFSRFNQLISQEALELEDADGKIAEALRSLSLGLVETARANATSALLSLAKANITSVSLSSAADALAKGLKTRQLTPEIMMVEGAIARYYGEIDAIRRSIEEIEAGNVTATAIGLSLSQNHVLLGDAVSLEGRLTEASSGAPIPGEEVEVLACGRAYTLVTDPEGRFSLTFTAAAPGGPDQMAAAAFLQHGDRAGSYATAPLTVNYVIPRIAVTTDRARALPGDTVAVGISATLSEWAAPLTPDVSVAFAQRLASALEGAQFALRVEAFNASYAIAEEYPVAAAASFAVPAGTASGRYSVTAAMDPASIFSGGTASAPVEVYRRATSVSVSAPSIALGGTSVTFKGSVSSSGSPVAGASVSVAFSGSSASASTGDDGSFSVALPVPAARASGWEAARVLAEPADDRLSPSSASASVLLISPFMAAIPAAGAIAATALAMRGRGRTGKWAAQAPPVAALGGAEARGLPPPDTLAGIYARAAQAVGAAIGIFARESETAREYLSRAMPGLGAVGKAFRELTLMLEEAVYGMRDVDASKGRRLLEAIMGFISSARRQPEGEKGAEGGVGR